MENVIQQMAQSQGDSVAVRFWGDGPTLSDADRCLILISSLGLFLRRARLGYSVTRDDITRLVNYGDPSSESDFPRRVAA